MSPALHCPKNMTSTAKSGHNGCRSLADESAFLVAQMVKVFLQCQRLRFNPWVGKIPWRRERLPTPVFWPGEFHGLYYSPGGRKESDTTERLSLFLCYMRGFMLQCYMHDFRKILQKSH